MALSGTVWGTFSGRTTSQARPRISWSVVNSEAERIANNETEIVATLWYENYGPYYAYNNSNTTTFSINGVSETLVRSWDLRNPPVTDAVWTKIVTIPHNADGTKTFNLSASADTSTSFGTMSVNGNQTLDTIPRQATITSSASFTAGNNIGISFNNPANGYLRVDLYVHNGSDYNYIKSQNFGAVSSGTMTFTDAEIDDIYSSFGTANSRTSLLRVHTYTSSAYNSVIGSYQDKTGTCSEPSRATTSSNADLTIGNDKTITISNPSGKYVRCEYWINGNAGWYKVKDDQTGTSGHTFSMSSTDNDNIYSRMPNVTSASARIRIYTYEHSDYTTQIRDYQEVTGTVSVNQTTNKPTFTTFTVANVDKTVDNVDKYSNTLVSSSTSTLLGVDTKMIKGYSKLRATITSANKMVALNYATASKYRFVSGAKYKEENYSAVDTVNLDIDNALVEDVTVTAYDSRSLTTAVTDSTTITNNAQYVAVSLWGMTLTRDNGVDAPTKLAFSGSYWNEYFGGGTSGVQNTITAHYRYKESTASWGTQTWNSITVTDTDGALSFDDYINGDLGASGFDTEKSFDIEVRAYDKLTNTIVEKTLSVGIPVMDITSGGVAFGERYDATEGGDIQVLGKSILDVMYPVGSIYTNATDDTNPATLMGFGTWSAFGSGRVMVGYDSGDTDFDTAEETGGAKTHTLTEAEMPVHTHTQNAHTHTDNSHRHGQKTGGDSGGTSRYKKSTSHGITNWEYAGGNTTNPTYGDAGMGTGVGTNNNAGSGGSHNNMPPYITVYMWKRTA